MDPRAAELAYPFLRLLPKEIRPPEIGVDPDGEVVLEWDMRPLETFAVSVSPQNELAYAGIFGRSKVHGVEFFTDEIPKRILAILEAVSSASGPFFSPASNCRSIGGPCTLSSRE